MRKLGLTIMVLAAVAVALPMPADEEPWFDLTNCAMCKNLAAEEGLMDSMKWEVHKIDNGMLSVAVIPAEHQAAFARAGEKMEAVVGKMQQGEQLPLCGFCKSYGNLAMHGAKSEEIHTKAGHISLTTSSDAKVVAMIHAHADRTNAEYEKWLAEQGAGGAGAGD